MYRAETTMHIFRVCDLTHTTMEAIPTCLEDLFSNTLRFFMIMDIYFCHILFYHDVQIKLTC